MADYPETGTEASSAAANKAEKTEPDAKLAAYWREIARYDKATEEWRQDGDRIISLYLQQAENGGSINSTTRQFPLLWANVETLKPAVYAKPPIAQCSRRHKDKDPNGRIAAEVMERCTNTTFDLYGLDEVLRMVRDDRLLPGRGQAWVRYEANFETVEGEAEDAAEADAGGYDSAMGAGAVLPNAGVPAEANSAAHAAVAGPSAPYERLTGEKVCIDYVHWQDFGHSLARTWKDVRMVWRRVYKTRDECTERFGKKIADKLVYNTKSPEDKDESGYKACVYEIWDKAKGKALWIAKEYHEIVEEGPPPLKFMNFFPCPEPCYATKTSKSLIPTPDYRYYRDQAKEINDLTQKIASLTDWLKLQGFVPAAPSSEGPDALKKLVERISNPDALLVEVESWAGFTERGGAGKIIDWLPVKEVALALREAITVRAQIIQDVFQITGISDIIRGQTDPNETLGAQELKAQTGSRRLKNTRDEIVRFSRDLTRLVCEVIGEQFQPETLAAMSGFKYLPSPQPGQIALPPTSAPLGVQAAPGPPGMQPSMPGGPPMPGMMGHGPPMDQPEQAGVFGDEVVQILRSDTARSFRIDIETDSTIQPDEDADKQRATEFVTAVGGFLNQSKEIAVSAPALLPMMGKALLFLVRRYRAGRELEDEIERGVSAMAQQAQQQMQQPKQDPETVKAQAKAEIDKKLAENQIGIDQQRAANERKIAEDNAASDRAIALLNAQNDMKIQTMKGTQEVVHKERAASTERELKKAGAEEELVRKRIDHAAERTHKDEGATQERELARKKVEPGPEAEAVKSVAEKLPDLVGKVVNEVMDKAGDAIEQRIKAIKSPPRVRKPTYDSAGNIIAVREEDAA